MINVTPFLHWPLAKSAEALSVYSIISPVSVQVVCTTFAEFSSNTAPADDLIVARTRLM